MALLLALVPMILVLALVAPIEWLLFSDLLLTSVAPPAEGTQFGSVFLDATDLVFAGLLGTFVVRRRSPDLPRLKEVPYFRLWLLLGVLLSLSYVTTPENQAHMTDPVRITYQLYRYCWKSILYYPFAILLLSGPLRTRSTFVVLVLVGLAFAIQAVPQGYGGGTVTGPFRSGNALGHALGVPLVACIGMLMLARSSRERAVFVAILVLIVRALTFTGSRGAMISAAAGIALLLWLMSKLPDVRARLLALGAVGMVVVFAAIALNPEILDAPSLQRYREIQSGTQVGTLQWRIQNRWPHFFELALKHPWLGIGTHMDSALGGVGSTPHNGYLAIAVANGFPALGVFVAFACLALRSTRRVFTNRTAHSDKVLSAVAASGLTLILVHNVVESSFMIAFGGKLFWLLSAFSLMLDPKRLRRPVAALKTPRHLPRVRAALDERVPETPARRAYPAGTTLTYG